MFVAFHLFSWGRESTCHSGGGHQRLTTGSQFSPPTWIPGVSWGLKKIFTLSGRGLWPLSPVVDIHKVTSNADLLMQ